MVKRWKDEIILGLVLLGCSAFGGFFGAKMAQLDAPVPTNVCDSSDTFGSLPPPPESVPMNYQQPPVILIVPERALYAVPPTLNPIQKSVNFI